jgi:hypothetical protein
MISHQTEIPVPIVAPMIKTEVLPKHEQLDAAIREILGKHQVGSLQFVMQGLNEIKKGQRRNLIK